jgi:hypothetical protein
MSFKELEALFKELKTYTQQSFTPWEWASLVLFTLGGQRFKNRNWIQFEKPSDSHFTSSEAESRNFIRAKSNSEIKCFLKAQLPSQNYNEFYAFYFKKMPSELPFWKSATSQRWKSISKNSLLSLRRWSEGDYKLVLKSHIPDSVEMALLQSQGKRAVTVFEKAADLEKTYEHSRDAYLFIAHDLEHAAHFFSENISHHLQKSFIELVRKTFLEEPPFSQWISPQFKKDFDYLISDMNSHPWHMYLSLQQILLNSHKLQARCFLADRLAEKEESHFQEKIQSLLSRWGMSYPPQCDAKFNQRLMGTSGL